MGAAKKVVRTTKPEEADEVTTSIARDKFADLIERVFFAKERIVIVRRGKQAAALIPIEDLELLERFEAEEEEQDLEDIEEAKKEQGDAPLHSLADVAAELGLPEPTKKTRGSRGLHRPTQQ
jgi:prevent-host-death family protein